MSLELVFRTEDGEIHISDPRHEPHGRRADGAGPRLGRRWRARNTDIRRGGAVKLDCIEFLECFAQEFARIGRIPQFLLDVRVRVLEKGFDVRDLRRRFRFSRGRVT